MAADLWSLDARQGNFAIAGNLIYFSFHPLTTVGYGPIVPLHPWGRGWIISKPIMVATLPANAAGSPRDNKLTGDKDVNKTDSLLPCPRARGISQW